MGSTTRGGRRAAWHWRVASLLAALLLGLAVLAAAGTASASPRAEQGRARPAAASTAGHARPTGDRPTGDRPAEGHSGRGGEVVALLFAGVLLLASAGPRPTIFVSYPRYTVDRY
jgi:hypothetical protein